MVNIGIIGCGGMGNMHSQACLATENVKLTAVADELTDKAKELAEKTECGWSGTPDELLQRDNVDAVMICTPTITHHPLAMKALAAGKHVFLEKPLARHLVLAEELVKEAERTQRFNQVGHVLRFWPEYVVLKEAIDDGRWGKLVSIKFHRVCAQPGWSTTNWYIDPAQSGGAALDLHLHDTDMVHYLLGMPQSVFSQGVNDATGWRQIVSQYLYDDGPAVYAEGTWYDAEQYGFCMTFVAAFEKGTLDYNSSRQASLLFYPQKGDALEPEMPKAPETKKVEGINITDLGGYLLQDQYFFECLEKGVAPERATFAHGRDALKTVEAEIRSAETTSIVSINNIDSG